MQLEAFRDGTLGRVILPDGQSAAIGTPIAELLLPGEEQGAGRPAAGPSPTGGTGSSDATAPTAPPSEPATPQPTSPPPATSQPMPAPPAEAAPQTTAPPAESPRSSDEGGERTGVPASPLARRIAEEMGIDLRSVKGTGPGGRITREDVEAAAREAREKEAAPQPAAPPAEPAVAPVQRPLTRMQETIARRMTQSKTTVPHFYVTAEVDMAEAVRLREQLNQAWTNTRVSFEEVIVKALGIALVEFPLVNASWRGDHLEYHQDVNVGVAVGVEGGLLVPVLHHVDRTDLRTLATQIKELRQRVRDGKARSGDFEGATFTVSNLGPFGIDEFQAIVNPPESAILAVGAIEKKPVARGDAIVLSERMRLTLSADHRVFYGVTAAQFLGRVKDLLEHPLSLLQ
jgi:pyruvate dehydrogenase E2 component (dihydrolipoamide acetyltransferase)